MTELSCNLRGELGLEPSAAVVDLEQRILQHDPALSRTASRSASFGQGVAPPAPLTRLIGRVEDLRQVGELFKSTRLVTIVGRPGAGKTRLASEYAQSEGRAISTWWADLATVDDGDEVSTTVAGAVGAITQSTDPISQAIERVRLEPCLLVIDNAEHVIDNTEVCVRRVLAESPSSRVLVTSRIALNVPGSAAWRLAGLPLAVEDATADELRSNAAVQLFLERASTAGAEPVQSEPDLRQVADITAKLDGLPLAMEIAASRLCSTDLRTLAANLPVLTRNPAEAGSRSGLRPAIEWSWSLLSPAASELLRRLSVFAGPFNLDSAQKLADRSQEETVAMLDELAQHSLLTHAPGAAPYRLLATVRAIGQDQLRDREQWAEMSQRHREVALEIASSGDQEASVHARDDLLAALGRSPENDPTAMWLAVHLGTSGSWLRKEFAPYSFSALEELAAKTTEPSFEGRSMPFCSRSTTPAPATIPTADVPQTRRSAPVRPSPGMRASWPPRFSAHTGTGGWATVRSLTMCSSRSRMAFLKAESTA